MRFIYSWHSNPETLKTWENTVQVTTYGGGKYKLRHGVLHNDTGPAVERQDGTVSWYQNGRLHREDGPALTSPDGTKQWFYNGRRHRVGGPALERATGEESWYQNGALHRLDGPAVEGREGNVWFFQGRLVPVYTQAQYQNWLEIQGHVI